MGIHNLHKLLRKYCPNAYEIVHLSNIAFQKIAIDTSLFLCKFKTICGEGRWLSAFVNLIVCLRTYNIHCIFIFDNGSPPEKITERDRRQEKTNDSDQKVFELEDALEHFHNTGEIRPILIELEKKRKTKSPPRLMKRTTTSAINIKTIEKEITRLRNQVLSVTKEDFDLLKQLFDSMGIPWYQAILEAETSCSDLCKRALVSGVLTDDTDVLAYASPVMLFNISIADHTCHRLNYSDILQQLELTQESFLDLCIMCGCDYNTHIPKIGPETAFKLIKTYKSIEAITASGIDTSILSHIRGRELFTQYKQLDVKPRFCYEPNWSNLQRILSENKVNTTLARIKGALETKIILEEKNDS